MIKPLGMQKIGIPSGNCVPEADTVAIGYRSTTSPLNLKSLSHCMKGGKGLCLVSLTVAAAETSSFDEEDTTSCSEPWATTTKNSETQ